MHGIQIEAREGMMRNAWLLRDDKGNILACGVIGQGRVNTPGMDPRKGVKFECHPGLYEQMKAAVK